MAEAGRNGSEDNEQPRRFSQGPGSGSHRGSGSGRSPRSSQDRSSQDRNQRHNTRDQRKPFGDRRASDRHGENRDERKEFARRERHTGARRDHGGTANRSPRHERRAPTDEELGKELLEAPELPEGIEFSELDEEIRRELRTLPRALAELVGKHLLAAGSLMDTEPDLALEHVKYAKVKASRVAVVREAYGLTAYHLGKWSEAISELRAVRRMTRSDIHIAVIADLERALGRPQRALDLARETNQAALPKETQVELQIVTAGARRDLDQLDAAVVSLQGPDLDPKKRDPWSARLFYAYADNLLAAGRKDEAIQWFLHAVEADSEEQTDAGERLTALADA